MLVNPLVLAHFDPAKPIILSCDASPYGVGAVLSQKQENKLIKSVAFASRTLNFAEKNYAQLDKEALTVVFGITRCHHYLYGQKFEIYTNHKPLLGLLGVRKSFPGMASARMQRWALLLSAHKYIMRFTPGVQNQSADALSRLPLNEYPELSHPRAKLVNLIEWVDNQPVTSTDIKHLTETDPILSQVKMFFLHGWPKTVDLSLIPYSRRRYELSLQNICLLWGTWIIVPEKFQAPILHELHAAHSGICHMKASARNYVWWPNLDTHIEEIVKHCDECQQCRSVSPKIPLSPWSWPLKPWRRIHIDYCGPLQGCMILIVVDAYSKWIEAIPLRTSTSTTTINVLRSIFSTHMIPETVVSDNRPAFISTKFQDFLRCNGVQHITSASYHPSSNGLAERAVQTVKQGIKKQKGDILTRLNRFLFGYRKTPQTTTGTLPGEMLMGRRLRTRLDLIRPNLEKDTYTKQDSMKKYYDKSTKARHLINEQPVYVRLESSSKELRKEVVTAGDGQLADINLPNGQAIRRHLDHVRERSITNESSHNQTDVVDNEPNTINNRNLSEQHQPFGGPSIGLSRTTRQVKPTERFQAGV